MKRKNPDTSLSAYRAVSVEMLNTHHSKIIKALKEIGSGTYEDISNFLQWDDKNRASRRLLELEKMELVWKPGAKKPTRSGRSAYVYQLREMPRTEEEVKTINDKYLAAYDATLNGKRKSAPNSNYVQARLL